MKEWMQKLPRSNLTNMSSLSDQKPFCLLVERGSAERRRIWLLPDAGSRVEGAFKGT